MKSAGPGPIYLCSGGSDIDCRVSGIAGFSDAAQNRTPNFWSDRVQSQQSYAKVIENSKRVRWDIDSDVIQQRDFDYNASFLPPGLSLLDEVQSLSKDERKLLSQIQGRTYCYLFGLVERFIAAKVLAVSRTHWLGSQTALEALVRMTDEELKHQELFRRLEEMMAKQMPLGYKRTADPDAVAELVLAKRTWSVLALILHIELFTLAHYRASIREGADICPLWKDVFHAHWLEESQHATLDELEFVAENKRLTGTERSAAVGDLIDLIGAIDGLLMRQASADAAYFASITKCGESRTAEVGDAILKAYRWQYIVSGVMQPRFQSVLFGMLEIEDQERIGAALKPFIGAQPSKPSAIVARD